MNALQASPHLMSPRSTKRYSALALQLPGSAYSRPAPTVQPTLVSLLPVRNGRLASILPSATPPVRYGRNWWEAEPMRPGTGAGHEVLVSPPSEEAAPAWPLVWG